ncbi:phage shock protein PspC (stress-responsive transcriptional regulator) [Pseudarthrobacter oxydans]|uniref:PspC domain-containing protein n=1 Tax=Pseudarthrobacter oxydans TaxID=1671 RepID=UPI0027843730|nr:PspC domain-containing protein [Pseudarthrobacter oxydans]MDP9984519.1 phage shock protein PspC (stress-responsive transcriptional regulator) [Pseudarthrobacter oxydans]
MNPHTEHPDEGTVPSGGNAGRPAGTNKGQTTGPKAGPSDGQNTEPSEGQAAGESAARPAGQPADTSATLPLDTSATLPLDFPAGAGAEAPRGSAADQRPAADTSATLPLDTSATLPLDFSAGSGGAGTPPLPPPPPPSYYGATPPPAGSQPQNFFDWTRSQGVYRGRERWVGGVASGIAQRLGIDPLIVRGILVVLAVFAGVGVLLYGIAWALLPEPDGRIHVQEAAAGRWSSGMTGALITTIIGFPSLGTGVWGWDRYGFGAFIWTVFWVGGAIYLIYYLTQRNKSRNGVTSMSSSPQTGGPANPGYPPNPITPAYPSDRSDRSDRSNPATPSAPTAPFATTGYGASATLPRYGETTVPGPAWGTPPPAGPTPPPGGGYQPVPGGGPVPPAKDRNFGPGAPAVAVTAGLALLVGGGLKALDVANVIDLGTSSNAVVWASAAVVLGLGILVAGLRGRTSGILGFFAVVALIVGGIFNLLPNADRFRPQNADWSPVSVEQARAGFDITAGTGTVDLTRLAINPPLRTDVVVPVNATASNLTVVIPDDVPVQIRADMTMGNLNEGTENHGGMTNQRSYYNTDKPGETLIVEIDGTFSNVTIREGN